MVILNKSITVSGVSVVNDEKKEHIAYMNATIQVDGKSNISRSIANKELFEANKEEVLKDFAAFDEYVYDLMEENNQKE